MTKRTPLRGRRLVFFVVTTILCACALGVWYIRSGSSPTSTTSSSPSSSRSLTDVSIRQQRQHLDRTVWAGEVVAQRYGDTFITFWDNLRNAKDKYAVLEGFPFEQLNVREAGSTEHLEGGVTLTQLDGPPAILTHDRWQTLLRDMETRGFELVQSEWHHEAFARDPDGTARSVVSMVLHISAADPEGKIIVKGKLNVTWLKEQDTQGAYVPRLIELEDATLLARSGDSVFRSKGKIKVFQKLQPVLLYDLDGDGNLEIILAGSNVVLWNRGHGQVGGKFKDEALCSHPEPDVSAAVLADFTGDGIADFLGAGMGAFPFLFSGAPDGRFPITGKKITATGQPLNTCLAITAGDVDGDGDLDVWLSQYKRPYVDGQMPTPYYDANDGFPSFLLLGDGRGGFRNATEASGLAKKRFRRTYSTSFVDLDDDGDLDLLVVSDFSGVDIYRNDGKGHFSDVTESVVGQRALFGMSHSFGDYNLDGALDIYVAGMSSTTARRLEHLGLGRDDFPDHQAMRMKMGYGNRMYLAQPDQTYREPSFGGQVARTGWSWGTTSFDFDNDGDLDIYVANGHLSRKTVKDYCTRFWCHDIYAGSSHEDPRLKEYFWKNMSLVRLQGISWNGYEHNHLFVNESGRRFRNEAFLMNVAFEFDARAVVSGDLDNDGRVDLLVLKEDEGDLARQGSAHEELFLLENHWPKTRHWIGVHLAGIPGRSPIGARITVRYPSGQQIARIVTGDAYRVQHAFQKHFGLGNVAHVDTIEVKWLDGTLDELKDPDVDQYHRIQ